MIWSLKVEYKRIDKVKVQHRVEWKICLKAKNENITQDQNKNTTQKKKKNMAQSQKGKYKLMVEKENISLGKYYSRPKQKI